MTKANTNTKVNAFADALSVESRKLSTANKKRASALALIARSERVQAFIEASKVDVAIVSDLYLTEKVIKCADALTREVATSADFNENTFCALKTALLNADTETFATDLIKASISNNFTLDKEQAKRCYRRANLISATRQEQLNVKLLNVLNITTAVSKTQSRVNADSHAFNAAQRVAEMSL